jgi:hypothetical protein
MKKWLAGVVAIVMTALFGCASIMNGTTQDVGISSSPSNARVTVDGRLAGKTPFIAQLKRKDNHTIKIELEGYQPFEATFTRSASGWVWGNLAFGGLIGLAIDAISGSMYKLTPEQMQAELKESAKEVSAIDKGDYLYLAVVLHPDPKWEKVGTLQN